MCLYRPLTVSGQTAAAHIRDSGSDFQQTAVKDEKYNRKPPTLAFEKYLKCKGILFHSDQIWSFPTSGVCL